MVADGQNKSVLLDLKRTAKQEVAKLECGPEAKNLQFMFNTLKGLVR